LYSFLLDLQKLNEYNIEAIKRVNVTRIWEDDLLMSRIYDKWLIDRQIITIYDNKKTKIKTTGTQ